MASNKTSLRLFVYSRKFVGSTWVLEHTISDEKVLFFATDENWKTIQPETVKRESGKVTASFPVSVTGYASSFKMAPILNSHIFELTNNTSITERHYYRSTRFLIQCWDSNGYLVNPESISKNELTFTVNFEKGFTGSVELVSMVGLEKLFEDETSWTFEHNVLESRGHIFTQITDDQDNVIVPKEEQRIDDNITSRQDNAIKLDWNETEISGKILSIIHGYRI